MAKKLNQSFNVNMQFTADTNRAKHQIQDLQNQLHSLINCPPVNVNVNTDKIREATTATAELSSHLKAAVNTNTGNLDFSKLSQSLKKSGKTLSEYGDQLKNLGPAGQKAFMSLTEAVVSSEIPIKRTNKMLKEFGDTLANTARWQLSSSILHGFMGALQSAYGYAQDLNESLNNIRIVTGRNIEDMAEFAKEANKAAKALSATTTEYTNASLIYYQQGLSDKQVKDRADVTIKLANVSRQSAEDVSEQMTAVWNNFYDGSKSIEHYADVMTALGAATASSTQEIAGGLEKFAAVADTIGLSYEYAAAALATITSNTRESEEVVGTALKTIFARIQGLNLGETLDDGTTLNKYSQALQAVGISIYDTENNLKDMDSILSEMGDKWHTISKAQQVALAQTVAGTRQYNQLVALMSNWNSGDSDSFMANLQTANSATGALQEQADIYAESWEGASDRVTAAAEAIYDSLINDEFFIDLLNNFEKLLTFVNNLIDGMGGLKGVLAALGTVLTKVFSQRLATSLTQLVENIKLNTKKGHQALVEERQNSVKKMADSMAKMHSEGEGAPEFNAASEIYENQLRLQSKLLDNQEKMNELEISTTKQLMDQAKLRGDVALEAAKALEAKKEEHAIAGNAIRATYAQHTRDKHGKYSGEFVSDEQAKIRRGAMASRDLSLVLFNGTEKPNAEAILQIFKQINDESKGIKILNQQDLQIVKGWAEELQNLEYGTDEYVDKVNQLQWKMEKTNAKISTHAQKVLGISETQVNDYIKTTQELADAKAKDAVASKKVEESNKLVEKSIDSAKGVQKSWADTLIAGINAVTATSSAISMLSGIVDTLSNPDLSGWEKFTTIMMTVSMLIPTLVTAWTSLKTIVNKDTLALVANTVAQIANNAAKKASPFNTKRNINQTKSFLKDNDISYDTKSGMYKSADCKKSYTREQIKELKNSKFRKGSNFKADVKTVGNTLKGGIKSAGNGIKAIGSKMGGAMSTAAPYLGMAAAIAIVAGAITWGVAQFNKYSNAAKQAAKVAQDATSAYENVAAAQEKFKSSLGEYKNARDGLKDLTKGTLEYEEALHKANEEARNLIDQGNLKMGTDYTIDENGVYQIGNEALENAQQAKLDEMKKASVNKQIAELNAKEAQTKADAVDLARGKIDSTSGSWAQVGNAAAATGVGIGAGALAGASLGAALGTIVPGIGNIIGAGTGAIVGGIAGLVTGIVGTVTSGASSGAEQEAIEKIAEQQRKGAGNQSGKSKEEYMEYLKTEVKITDPTLIESLAENREAVEKLAEEMNANEDAVNALNAQIAADAVANNRAAQASEYTKEIQDTISKNFIDEDKQKKLDELEAAGWGTSGISQATVVNDEAKRIFKEYASAAGLGNDVKVVDTQGDNNNRIFIYEDADGNKHTVDLTTMRDTVASDSAKTEADKRATELAQIFGSFDKSQMAAVNALLNKDYSNLNASQFENGFASMTAESLGLNAEELKALGYDSAKAFNDAMKEASKNAVDDWNNNLSNYSKTVQGIVEGITDNQEDFSYGVLKAYGDMLENIGSDEQADKFNAALQELMKKNSDDAEAIMQAASGIDWSKGPEAVNELNYQLLQMGIKIEGGTKAWDDFETAIKEAGLGLSVLNQDLDSIRTKLKDIAEITKGVSFGDVISDEAYDKLIKYNAELEKYFIMTADGYQYIGGAEGGIQGLASEYVTNQLAEAFETNQRARTADEAFDAVNWSDGTKVSWLALANGKESNVNMANMANALSGADYEQYLNSIGTSQLELSELATQVKSTDAEISNSAREKLKAIFNNIVELQAKVAEGKYDDDKSAELIASETIRSMDDIEKYRDTFYKEGQGEAFEKRVKVLKGQLLDVKVDVVKDKIDKLNDELSRASKLKDDVFGESRLSAIDNEISHMQNLIEEHKKYQETLKLTLNFQANQLKELGVEFDKAGNITNKESLANAYTGDWAEFSKQLDDYEKNLDLFKNSKESVADLKRQISQANLEKITYKIEYKLEIDDRELRFLDYKLNKIADDVYKKFEGLTLLIGNIDVDGNLNIANSKLGTVLDNYKIYSDAKDSLDAQYASGQINQAHYVEGLNQVFNNVMDNLEAIQELDNTMLNYYGETLTAVSEKLDTYSDRLEAHTGVLDHYKNILGIIGEEKNYEKIGIILEGQAHVAQNSLKASTAAYEMYAAEAAKWKEQMEAAVPGSAAFELYEKNWEAAEEKSREAQDKMLSDMEAWANAEKAILENNLAQLGSTLEKSLTGGTTFDRLATSMERAASLQEEYLTTTNQIYETTKLMRTAQQEIDKSTNTVAKNKLKNFITETKVLQDQGKLSKFELEIQQAKYDLLIAELALEEARNAKNTVRLQRDSEGNFGYVYTADSEQINNALQTFDDAQNALYNKGLEASNKYVEQYQQTMSDMYSTLSQLQTDYLNGAFSSEQEYNDAVAEAKEYYYQKLEDFSALYSVAVQTDSRITADAWSSNYEDMVNSTDYWKTEVNDYIDAVEENFRDWEKAVDDIQSNAHTDLDNLATDVKDIKDESDELITTILGENGKGGLIDAFSQELTKVGNLITEYGEYRDAVQAVIEKLETLAGTANDAANAVGNVTGGNNGSENDGDGLGGSDKTETGGKEPETGYVGDGVVADVETKENPLITKVKQKLGEPKKDYKILQYTTQYPNGTPVKYIKFYDTYALQTRLGETIEQKAQNNLASLVGTAVKYGNEEWNFIDRNGKISEWATGGYTGEWGPEGKLAVLHEKEIVLNKHDTENFLMAIDMLDTILSTIDSYASSQQIGGILTSPGYASFSNGPVEQNVHIEASFPNVSDHNEIEEALNNLVNKASQYIHGK